MIKLYTAFTNEIDNPEAAVREIKDQLNLSENLLKNAVGIVQLYYEYVETGVYMALVNALPFDIVGCVSTSIGVSGHYGDFILSVSLITSDDIKFSTSVFQDTDKKSRKEITHELTSLFAELSESEKPKMVLSFMPILQQFSGDDLVSAANALPEPYPLFGILALNAENKPETNFVLNGARISPDIMSFVAFYGDFEPKFRIITSLDNEETFGDAVEITDSDGPVLKTVNGMPSVDFLIKQGIINNDSMVTGDANVVGTIPAVLTRKDGTKIVRAFLGIVDENPDYVFAAGNLEVGSKISFSFLDGDKTLLSAEKFMTEIHASNERNFIAFSCAGRAWSLGSKYLEELKKITQISDEYRERNMPVEYCVSYAAGEICPVMDENGKLVNTFHNYSLVSCSFD